MFSKKSGEAMQPAPQRSTRPMASGNSTFSVIGSDVSIRGDITASVDLHVDGKVEGDITCASLVQGEGSEVIGGIDAETARLSGTVRGTIKTRDLVILKTARVEGDVHYDALTIEQGAIVQGNFAQAGAQAISAKTTTSSDGSADNTPQITLAG